MAATLPDPEDIPELDLETLDPRYFQPGKDSILRRGRTPERIPHSRTDSRNSSASSTRTMIDARMEMANEERSRSASRPAPEPASPFSESSPYHPSRQGSQTGAWDVPHTMTLAEHSATTVFPTQGSLDPEAESDSEDDDEPYYVTLKSYAYEGDMTSRERRLRMRTVIKRHMHVDEVAHLEQVKQACSEKDHDYITKWFGF